MARKISVQLVGDSGSLEKAFDRANRKGKQFESSMGRSASSLKGYAKAGLAGAAIAGTALVVKGLTSSISAAKEAQVAQVNLQQALKQSGNSYKRYGTQIENAIQKTSKLAAIDDEDLSDAFSKLVRTTGSVTKATKGMALAANIARGRNIPLATATKVVERALLGQVGSLRRVGVEASKVTETQEAVKFRYRELAKTMKGELTPALQAQMQADLDAAKAKDAHLTKVRAMTEAQKKFAGSGAAYAKTYAGAQERFGVAVENLQEKIGQKLLPVLTKMTLKATEFVENVERDWPKIQAKIDSATAAVKRLYDAIKPVVNLVPGGEGTMIGILLGGALAAKIAAAGARVIALNRALLVTSLRLAPIVAGLLAIQQFQEEGLWGKNGFQWSDIFSRKSLPGYGWLYATSGGRTPKGSSQANPMQKRAMGGPVSAGRTYLVGERGPETLVMGSRSGYVIPNGGGGATIVLQSPNFYGVQNVQQLISEIQRVARHGVAQQRGRYGGTNLGIG